MIYKNLSHATKTFYGVTFKPGEEKEVEGYINDTKFIRIPTFSTNQSKLKLSKNKEEKADGSNSD